MGQAQAGSSVLKGMGELTEGLGLHGAAPKAPTGANPRSEAAGTFSVISFMEATVVTSKWPLLRL